MSENPLFRFPDRARRMSDIIAQLWVDHGYEGLDRWVAFRFADGGSDRKLYDTKTEAIKHQFREDECCYLPLPDHMSPAACDSYLRVHEGFYRMGMRVSDPDEFAPHIDAPIRREDPAWQQMGLIIPRFSPRNLRSSSGTAGK